MSLIQQDTPEQRFVWTGSGIFIIALHAVTLLALPSYFALGHPSWAVVVATGVVLFLSHIGITAGYHRLYAHRAYSLSPVVEAALLFLGTMALQGSVVRWSFDHRAHHRYVDRDGDPYNVRRGFWHAHVLWIFRRQRRIDDTVKDLLAKPMVRFQHEHFVPLAIASNLAVFLVAGWILKNLLGAAVFVVGVRLVLSYHITWCINSLAHYWGSRSYSKEQTARDNYLVALITAGEGYHNYHHTFPADYRNGIRWFHVDPGKWIIWLLSKAGLAWGLKRQPTTMIQRTLIRLDTQLLLERIQQAATDRAADLKAKLEARFGALATLEASVLELSKSLKARNEEIARLQLKEGALRRRPSRLRSAALRRRLHSLRRAHRVEWARWCHLCGAILQA
jgi:stearoyl-CoA desaturase (delta-9 desaturase)